jgi:hypothetical protein
MNYQEYDWFFDPNSAPKGSSSSTDPWLSGVNFGTCIGNSCCSEGLTYDSDLNECVVSTTNATNTTNAANNTTSTETSVNQMLTKQQPGNYKISYNLKQPEPFNTQY